MAAEGFLGNHPALFVLVRVPVMVHCVNWYRDACGKNKGKKGADPDNPYVQS